jgi:HD domain
VVPATLLPASAGASTLEYMSALRTTIAGIPIPDSTLASDATQFVQDLSTQLLFDHSRRVFLWASLQGEKLGLDNDPELLYVGAMFHDIGLVDGHRSEHERFEIDGANAAFGTMNTDILEATVPGYVRPNFCDYIQNSRFET